MTGNAGNGWKLSVTRLINAPPEVVWQIMTERLTEWWCPKPWTSEIIEQDWCAGGRCAIVMHGPNGETSGGDGIFLEVTPGKRFVTTDAVGNGWIPQKPFMIGGWEIEPDGDGTRYTAWARHWDEAAMKSHEEMGFTTGWGAVADQLTALAEGVTG